MNDLVVTRRHALLNTWGPYNYKAAQHRVQRTVGTRRIILTSSWHGAFSVSTASPCSHLNRLLQAIEL